MFILHPLPSFGKPRYEGRESTCSCSIEGRVP